MRKKIAILLVIIMVMICTVPVSADSVSWECPRCGADAAGNYCSNCGEEKPDWECPVCGEVMTGNFCSNCGTERPAKTADVPAAETNGKAEGDGFDSPEEALGAYIEGLKNNDIDQMLSAFAVETYAKNYSVLKLVERIGCFSPVIKYIPSVSDFSLRLNVESRRAEIMNAIHAQYLVLEKSKTVIGDDAGMTIFMDDYYSEEELVDDLFVNDDTAILSNIEFRDEFIEPDVISSEYSSDHIQDIIERQIDVYGGEKGTSVVAVLYCNGERILLMADAVRYGGKWYLEEMGGILSDLLNVPYTQCGMMPLKKEQAENFEKYVMGWIPETEEAAEEAVEEAAEEAVEEAVEEVAEEAVEEAAEEAAEEAIEYEEAAEEAAEVVEEAVATDGINVCIASEPDTIDPALNSAVDGATMIVHLFSGLAKWEQNEDGSFAIVPDCAEELTEGVENEDGTVTYTYTLRDGLKWSDGEPVTAGDFEFSWKRAVSTELGADYAYMYDQVVGYDEIWETKETGETDEEGNPVEEFDNPDVEQLAVKATDDKTLEVTLKQAVPYWNELLAFPTFFPVRKDVVENEAWATDPSTYVCNGAYTMSAWQHNSVITLVKNENYIDKDEITMPAINFYLSDDANNMLTNFENGDWKLIDDVSTNEIASLKEEYPDEFVVAGQLGTYYIGWNVNKEILPEGCELEGKEAEEARAEIRNAISLLYDRNYIVTDIAQGGQTPASSFVSSGLTDADGKTDFSENAGHNDGFVGYYDVSEDALESNYEQAIEVLKKYYDFDEETQQVTNFPTLTYLYNTSEGHKAIGEYLQSAVAAVGINMSLENQEWNTFLNTRKAGDYFVARNGWLCDYNDPISMLDMWITASGNNDCQFGKGEHANTKAYSLDLTDLGYDTKVEDGTWAETYDVLIADVKSCTDPEVRYELMHRAEDLLMSTGAICPLYYYTDLYMIDDSVKGFFSIPLGYKYFMYSTIENN